MLSPFGQWWQYTPPSSSGYSLSQSVAVLPPFPVTFSSISSSKFYYNHLKGSADPIEPCTYQNNNDENLDIKINGEIVERERKIQNRVKKEKEGLQKFKANMEKKKSLKWYKNKEKPKNEKIYNGSWESTLLFKVRADSFEVNEKRRNEKGKKIQVKNVR